MKETNKNLFKPVYLLVLLPLLSAGIYLFLMSLGYAEGFNVIGFLVFMAAAASWVYVGVLFSGARLTFVRATVIANGIPLCIIAVYTVLLVIAKFGDMEALLNATMIIGGLGMGVFGLFGAMLAEIIPIEGFYLFEPFIDMVFYLSVFAVGFAIGTSRNAKREKKIRK